jgi:hypothetical protein
VLSPDAASYMTVGAVGSCAAAVSQPVIAYVLPPSGSSFDAVLRAPPGASPPSSGAGGAGPPPPPAAPPSQIVSWRAPEGGDADEGAPPPPADWRALAKAGLKAIYGVTIRGGPKDQLLGMLNVGFVHPSEQELKVLARGCVGRPARASAIKSAGWLWRHQTVGRAVLLSTAPASPPLPVISQGSMFQTYLTLVGATITAVAKDATLQQYLVVSRELQVGGVPGWGGGESCGGEGSGGRGAAAVPGGLEGAAGGCLWFGLAGSRQRVRERRSADGSRAQLLAPGFCLNTLAPPPCPARADGAHAR